MRRVCLLLSLLVVVGGVPVALAGDDGHTFRANLSGYNEVHFATIPVAIPNPAPPPAPATINVLSAAALRGAISTAARGKFRATIQKDAIEYELSYEASRRM